MIDDIIVKLKAFMLSMSKDTQRRGIDDIAQSAYAPIVRASFSKPCYVLVIGKYSHVTKAKHAEQRFRDHHRKKETLRAAASATHVDHMREVQASDNMHSFLARQSAGAAAPDNCNVLSSLSSRNNLCLIKCKHGTVLTYESSNALVLKTLGLLPTVFD